MHKAFGLCFDLSPGYLDTASIGVPPTVGADALSAAVDRWRRGGDFPQDSMRLSMPPVPASPTLSEYQHNGWRSVAGYHRWSGWWPLLYRLLVECLSPRGISPALPGRSPPRPVTASW
jgi:hypothetical protein